MDGLEEKLGSILANPEMMGKIMSMAQSLGLSQESQTSTPPLVTESPLPNIDPGMLQKLSGLTRQGNINKDQQNLLHALQPYLSRDRIHKLENAMRAAKMAQFVSSVLNQQGVFLPRG